jgi:putative ABC transport system permease protein
MRMQMVSGKSFAEATPEEAAHAVILNESALKAFGIKDPSQEMIQNQRILGIVRDFNVHSLREPIAPVIITCNLEYLSEVAIRIGHDADLPATIKFIETKSAAFNDGRPMNMQFFDERLDDMYGNDYRFAGMIGYFTGLAIFIACLGLFGVSLFVIQSRVKEIGVRKVMGASVGSVLYLVAKEFILLIVISTIIAIPITMYLIERWLQNYAYRVNVDVVVVLVTLFAATFIVMVTIGYQALRAATANPVEALRYE